MAMKKKAPARAPESETPGGWSSFEGTISTLDQMNVELAQHDNYMLSLERGKDKLFYHDFLLQGRDCWWRIRTRIALLKDAGERAPDELLKRLLRHLRVLRTDTEKIQLVVLRERYSGRKRGAVGENQKVIRELLNKDSSADTTTLWYSFQRARPGALQRKSFNVEASKARKALKIKKG